MGKHFKALICVFMLWFSAPVLQAQEPVRVLWWDGSPTYEGATNAQDRAAMALYVDGFGGGTQFAVTFQSSTRAGALAEQMKRGTYDILVLDVTTTSANFTTADLAAVQAHYQSGKNALLLDGTLWIRNARPGPMTLFPGPNGASAALLMNQIQALVDAGGGILLGTDHREFQVGANQLLRAILPGAHFSGRTNPSRDGAFIGDVLLRAAVPVAPLDILRHWEEVPSQAEAPVGQFTDFLGHAVTLHALVETSDKPGSRAKRPYISASFAPGDGRTAIDDDAVPEAVKEPDNMPTRKSGRAP